MARDTTDLTPIESRDQLVRELESGCKPKEAWRIGTEHEKFGFFRHDFSPVPYDAPDGEGSIRALLEGMRGDRPTGNRYLDEGKLIGLAGGSGEGAISLEPGGQFELSGAPLETIHDTCRESNAHLSQVKEVADPLGIGFLGLGGSPKWTLDETPEMPKSRYDIMRRYMPKIGTQGLDMMHRTCTIQVNLDFASEADMRRKMQVSTKLQSVAAALFANSPFTNGKPNGLLSWRSDIWRDTDNQRSGVLPFIFDDGFGFEHYVDWALDVPMYFVTRDGHYHDCTDVTFRQFLDGAKVGADSGRRSQRGRLDEPSLHAVSRCADEEISGNARCRWWPMAAHLRAAGLSGSGCSTTMRRWAKRRRWWPISITMPFSPCARRCRRRGLPHRPASAPCLDLARETVAIAERGLRARGTG